MIHTYPNNLPLWQYVTKPQKTNEHMREVINHLTRYHLLNTIKSILIQTLEKFCKKRQKNGHFYPWPLRSKLGLALFDRSSVYETNNRKMRRLRIGDRKMAKNLHDSRRKNELITGHRILIDIYKGEYEVRGKIYGKPLKEGQQKSSTRLCDRVIVRQRMKNKCHHHIKESRTICKVRARGVLTVTPR